VCASHVTYSSNVTYMNEVISRCDMGTEIVLHMCESCHICESRDVYGQNHFYAVHGLLTSCHLCVSHVTYSRHVTYKKQITLYVFPCVTRATEVTSRMCESCYTYIRTHFYI